MIKDTFLSAEVCPLPRKKGSGFLEAVGWAGQQGESAEECFSPYPLSQLHSPQEREVLLAQNKKEKETWCVQNLPLNWCCRQWRIITLQRLWDFQKHTWKYSHHLKELEETDQPFCLSLNMEQHILLHESSNSGLSCERTSWHMYSSPRTWQWIPAEPIPPWLSLCMAVWGSKL